jgi:hypothetical protein
MSAFLQPLAWMAVFYLPPAVVILWLVRTKLDHEARARQPFTDQPLRLAGESTREKADQLFEDGHQDVLLILIMCPVFGLMISQTPQSQRLVFGITIFVLMAVMTAILGVRLCKKIKQSWHYRLGAKGEQIVGRELDRLIGQGYRVFHDMPFLDWNIDHVVVGPRGVFAVETKAWRKPPKTADGTAEIILDGDTLILPGNRSQTEAIAQADRNARALAKWISKMAAEEVAVVPAVALPGWKLSIRRYGEVAVYSATNMSEHLPKRGKQLLTEEQIQRIAAQVEKQCTVPVATK